MKLEFVIITGAKNDEQRMACRETWLKDVPKDSLVTFCGIGDQQVEGERLFWTLGLTEADYVFVCTDQTYVNVERLLDLDFDYHHYLGCPATLDAANGKNCTMAHGGAGFVISRKAISKALEIGIDHPGILDRSRGDRAVGYAMEMAGFMCYPEYRFNPGRYVKEQGYCNLVPQASNSYITTNFATTAVMRMVHDHFTFGAKLPPNVYVVETDGKEILFEEYEGEWWWHEEGGVKANGPYSYALQAEQWAFNGK